MELDQHDTVLVLHCCNNTLSEIDADDVQRINTLFAFRCMCGDTVFVGERQLDSWNTPDDPAYTPNERRRIAEWALVEADWLEE